MPLKRVIEHYGQAPQHGHWKKFTCPFCKKKNKAGVFETGGVEMFKCQSTKCPTTAKAMPAVQYIAHVSGLSNRDAFIEYLKMAGVWKERATLKSPVKAPPISETPTGAGGSPALPTEVAEKKGVEEAESHLEKTAEVGTVGAGVGLGANIISPEFPKNKIGKPAGEEFIPGQAALEAFYERLTLSPDDQREIFEKRGLATSTQVALGYRSNLRSNKEILLALRETHPLEELRAAGLWLPPDKQRKKDLRPNSQFCGAGRIRKLKHGEKPGHEQWRDEDGNLWGWCEPVLIPYCDETGRLIGLRPHKGMSPRETLAGEPRIYVPRRIELLFPALSPPDGERMSARQPENFPTVVITEGEFKAAALWQVVGAGRDDGGKAVGVVALPGITFGKHFAVRMELEAWLRRVECRCVKVAFDHEQKPPEAKGRFDSIRWARYLATDLHRKLHIRAEVCVLPIEWADANAKSDWDGALAKIVKEAA